MAYPGALPSPAQSAPRHGGATGWNTYARTNHNGANIANPDRSVVHWFALTCVWLTFAASAFVFSEPAPVDALAIGLVLLLPVIGLTYISKSLVIYLALWFIAAAGHFLACANAYDISSAATFSGVSLYLYVASFVIAAFVAHSPNAHTKLIFNAWTCAAVLATLLALIGYIGAVPGAQELFTKFGRASGTFKDPNVFGAFLVAPTLYMLHLAITRPVSKIFGPLLTAAILAVGVLLCFSRGAWLNLAAAICIYGYLAFVTAPTYFQRARITTLLTVGIFIGIAVIAVAVQFDRVADLLVQRASLVQTYDSGHEGRFGGQVKAIALISQHPFGIGANEFGTRHHHEEVHNVYLSIMLNAGWLGGGIYWILVALTAALGLRHALTPSPTRPVFLVFYAAFIATSLEGLVIDTDHWRHFYTLMGICWGLMAAPTHLRNNSAPTTLATTEEAHRQPQRPARIIQPL